MWCYVTNCELVFFWQRKPRGTLSMKRISRKSSKHKSLLKRVHRQMMKEQRSGLFQNEEVRQRHPLKNNHLTSGKAFYLRYPIMSAVFLEPLKMTSLHSQNWFNFVILFSGNFTELKKWGGIQWLGSWHSLLISPF